MAVSVNIQFAQYLHKKKEMFWKWDHAKNFTGF